MKNVLKRSLVVLMAVLMVFSVAGCGKDNKTAVGDVKISDVNQFPIVEEPVELEIFISKQSTLEDIETNEFTKWYEEKTGVHIKWDIAQGDTAQALNLRIASGDLPDIIMGCGPDIITVNSYGQQGIFMDMTELIDKHSYYFKDVLEKRPDIRQKITMDGKIYGLPSIQESEGMSTLNKMWVYEPWLKKLNLDIPETTDEFYEMLKAFKEKDPNGNGKADEIPLVARGVLNNWGLEDYLMNSFVYSNTLSKRLFIENDKVKFSPVQDGYREGLKYINKLYDEGLILKDVFTIDRTTLTSYGENNPALVGAGCGQWAGMFTLADAPSGRIREYVAIPPLKGPTGIRQTADTSVASGAPSAFHITKDCPYPEIAMKWVDWFYSEEGNRKATGNVGFRPAKEGEIGLNGKQAKWTYDPSLVEEGSDVMGSVQNKNWGVNLAPKYSDVEMAGAQKLLDGDLNGIMHIESVNKYKPYKVNKGFPNIAIDADAAAEYNDLEFTIRDACDMAFAAFVTGEKDPYDDKVWEAHKKELKGYGLDRYLELAQARYDKYFEK